jgi:membrane fusion protein (multidrug efflux system)
VKVRMTKQRLRTSQVGVFAGEALLFATMCILVVSVSSCGTPVSAAAQQPGATGQERAAQPATGTTPLAVPVVAVVSQSLDRTLSLPGDLVAFQDVAIHARVQGFIEAMGVDRGSVVRKGALLARIVAPELRAQLSEADAKVQTAEAQLLESQAGLISEQSTFDRLKNASATPGVVAGNDVSIAEQKVAGAKARVEASAKNVEAMRQAARSLRELESYLQVIAPFDGVITERGAHVGTLVGPSSMPIVRLQQVSRLRLVVTIPEAYVGGVGVGQSIPFSVAAFPGQTFAGKLARIAGALDPKTRTMAIELDVANTRQQLAPGMFAEVQWPARRSGASLFVPRTAVATTTERTFVVRIRNDVAEYVDVRRGAVANNLVEVFGSLKAGEDVAVRATDEIRNGTPVRAVRQPAK